MKKVWRVFLDDNDLYTKKNDREDPCPICCIELSRWCIDCVVGTVPVLNIASVEQVWLFLLICNKRRDCLFAILDKHIITKIFKLYLRGTKINTTCSVVHLECYHVYHRHCFSQWIAKKQDCPLDGSFNIMPIKISYDTRVVRCGKLLEQFDTNDSVKTIQKDANTRFIKMNQVRALCCPHTF
jgi:hypothetical protein